MIRVFLAAFAFLATPVLANNYDFPHILVTGYGEVTAKPDRAEISVRVVESTMTAEQAKQTVDKVVDDFTRRLIEQGIKPEHIDSANISLRPEYHRPDDGQVELVGYRATRTVKVTVVDLKLLDNLLTGAIGEGINSIDYVRLLVSEEQSYRELARMAAIRDANQKAASLANGFGMNLGGVWEINYQHRGPVRASASENVAFDSARKVKDYSDATITISDDVQVTYQLD